MGDGFALYQEDGRQQAGDCGEDAGGAILPAGGDFGLAMEQSHGVPVDADGDGAPDGLAFDVDHDGLTDAVEVDTDGDGMGDTGLFDLDQDGVADIVTTDTDGDGTADAGSDHAAHSLSGVPDDVTPGDVHDAAQDLDTQSHIQSGMHDMYGAIYHEPVDPF